MIFHRSTEAFVYLITVVFVACSIYYLWISHLFFDKQNVLPASFQSSYNNICKCSGWHESSKEWLAGSLNNEIKSCFTSNKDKLLSVARKTFSPLAQTQYEQCLDFVLLISNESDILFAIKSCIINANQLDKSLNEIVDVNESNTNYVLVVLCSILIGYFYIDKTYKTNLIASTKINAISENESVLQVSQNRSTKSKFGNESQSLRSSASNKVSTRFASSKKIPQTFAKTYPVPIRFSSKVHTVMNQAIPMVMIPRNPSTVPYISGAVPCLSMKSEVSNRKSAIESIKAKKIGSEYSCNTYQSDDYRSKPSWKKYDGNDTKSNSETINFISDGNSSTPKKQKITSEIMSTEFYPEHIPESPENKRRGKVDTRNVLDGLDNLDLDFSDHTVTVVSADEKKDFKKLKENIQSEFKNSILLAAKKTQKGVSPGSGADMTKGKDHSKVGKDLVEKVAFNVIGSDRDNRMKISSNVNHFLSCPPRAFSGQWPNASVNDYDKFSYHDMNGDFCPKYMASPLFGNPIWNVPDNVTDNARNNCHVQMDNFS